jgi:hypothetical protein
MEKRHVSVAERVIVWPATMDRAHIRRDEALVRGRIGATRHHRSGRRGDDRRDVRFASPHGLE